ncbi:hypothetical protein HPP92_013900 [Vanilla planifolia]|uniref:Uncharacterized protein n=1 Tax=Vanilla planifolia TaxID=51239 RepID=A0A835QZF6_VANPL|nr:hypothetical protein HPP92_014308 [Vanilla planifolia]KAG0479181.1 hypothetical protein HPP92_013900 [Vanilla planifolia]
MTSSPCSSSSASNLLVKEEEEAMEVGGGVMEVGDVDQNGGYCTPASPESRIPAVVKCPPAPRKLNMRRRREAWICSGGRRFEFMEGLGLVVFKEVRCLGRRRTKTKRGKLALKSEVGKL